MKTFFIITLLISATLAAPLPLNFDSASLPLANLSSTCQAVIQKQWQNMENLKDACFTSFPPMNITGLPVNSAVSLLQSGLSAGLPYMCSNNCSNFIDAVFNPELRQACGNQVLYSFSSNSMTNTSLPSIPGLDINSLKNAVITINDVEQIIRMVVQGACLKNNGEYCPVQLVPVLAKLITSSMNPDGSINSQLIVGQIMKPDFLCQPCIGMELAVVASYGAKIQMMSTLNPILAIANNLISGSCPSTPTATKDVVATTTAKPTSNAFKSLPFLFLIFLIL